MYDFKKATVVSSAYEQHGLDPIPTQMLTVSVTSPADIRKVEFLPGTGRDIRLIPGAIVYILPVVGNSGYLVAVCDYSILPEDADMSEGDNDIHANVAGVKVSQVKCCADGRVVISDTTGLNKIEVGPTGITFTVAGLTYGAATHIHPTPVGPSSPPTPGT